MLTSDREEAALRCAQRLTAIARTSVGVIAGTLGMLARHERTDTQGLSVSFRWAHPTVRAQSIEALIEAGALAREGATYRTDPELLGAVRLVLRAIAFHVTSHTTECPAVYVTPPDLLPALTGDVGELRRLLIDLIASARSHVRIVTPFFSEIALHEVLSPLDRPDVRASLALYLSLHPSERFRGRALLHAINERFPERRVSAYLNVRPGDQTSPLPHAKLLLCDGVVGYLGSANVSLHGLHEQFEVGVRLEARAVTVLEQALDMLVRRGTYTIWSPEEDKTPIL